ncbi:TPA: hypothetical protein ACPY9J_002274 [Yersinia enterocolitica]
MTMNKNKQYKCSIICKDDIVLNIEKWATVLAGKYCAIEGPDFCNVTAGNEAYIVLNDYGTVNAGDYSYVVGGDYCQLSAGEDSQLWGGSGSTLSGGDGSELRFKWWDGSKFVTLLAVVDNCRYISGEKYKLVNGCVVSDE